MNKKKQKDLLIEIMRGDEELGLYDERKSKIKHSSPEVYNHNDDDEPSVSIKEKIVLWIMYAIIMLLLTFVFFQSVWH